MALIGGGGQLATDIARLWTASEAGGRGDELVCLSHAELDVTDGEHARAVLTSMAPSLVINTAAFVRVDDCESRTLRALEVNAVGPKNLAEVCRDIGATLAHFSTDYVFDGAKGTPYVETDAAVPVNAYGVSKLAGEHFVRAVLPEGHLIVRSSGLYGVAGSSGKGGNFVETMVRLAREGRTVSVVDDQVLAPTSTYDLAEAFLRLVALGGRGVFHVTNAGQCSWREFAAAIFERLGLRPELRAIDSATYGAAARRPAYSVLANARLADAGLPALRPWQAALEHYLTLRGHLVA